MLERRVSNNRADLSNDQQMNYLLSWFNNWSDLQKDDFVPVMAETMSSKHAHLNGITTSLSNLNCLDSVKRRPSLFDCQMTLYREYVRSWSDDQKNYLILRLKEIDSVFGRKYENFLQYGKDSPERDFFEPGIPPELDRSSNPASLNTSIDEEGLGKAAEVVVADPAEDVGEPNNDEDDEDEDSEFKKDEPISTVSLDGESSDGETFDDMCKPSSAALSPIAEDIEAGGS